MAATTAFEKHGHIARVACRTYTLSLALSLLPALIPAISKPQPSARVLKILKRELAPTGFAFSMTLAVAGGTLLDKCLKESETSYPSWKPPALLPTRRTFLANAISSTLAIILFASRKKRPVPSTSAIPFTLSLYQDNSPTLDLTLLILVRALDAHVQTYLQNHHLDTSDKEGEKPSKYYILRLVVKQMDVILFWLACARIMWCFCYEPTRLPRSYVKWINSLADMDTRLITALQALRDGTWKYGKPVLKENISLEGMAHDLGMDSRLGNPAYLPAYGGLLANRVWKEFNINGRKGVGGIPCDIVHSGAAGNSCTGNAIVRFRRAFIRAILIYAPVHIIPGLLARPKQLLQRPLPVILAIFRSATFLSTFVSSFWFAVCFTRSLVLARFFPGISHDFYDGPYGCVLAGCLVCGFSIGIEKQKRRGEIALYVLPRAVRSCLPSGWLSLRNRTAQTFERLIFILSLASILTSAVHRPRSLRGLSKWTLNYIMSEKSV